MESAMKSKSINDGVERTFVLVLDQGEEAFKSITEFADRERISGASVSAIGAFSKAKVGWFDLHARKYKPIEVNEQCEVLSLIGDVAQGDDGKASLHLHAVLGLQDGTLRGGHLLSGSVQPTLEVTITETVVNLRRKKRPDLGIALISI
jgi:predicted DNA-binding protein with PD1-like motif